MCSTALVLAPTVLLSSSPEDNKLLRVVLAKSDRSASNCWKSLLEGGQYKCNPWVLDQMEKKLTLERFQREVSNNKKRETNWNQWESLSLDPRLLAWLPSLAVRQNTADWGPGNEASGCIRYQN